MVYMHLAQLVEREAFNLVVVGSSPTVRKLTYTEVRRLYTFVFYAVCVI